MANVKLSELPSASNPLGSGDSVIGIQSGVDVLFSNDQIVVAPTLQVTDGDDTVTAVSTLTFSGATISGSTDNATITISGGGGGSLTLSDADDNSVTGVTSITVTGGVIGGTTPNATLTISGGGGGAWNNGNGVNSNTVTDPTSWSAGQGNNVSGDDDVVSGDDQVVSGSYNDVSGSTNTVTGNSNLVGGAVNSVSGTYGIIGGIFAADRGIFGTSGSGIAVFGDVGKGQNFRYGLGGITTDGTTPVVLTFDSNTPSATNQLALPNGQNSALGAAYVFTGQLVAVDPATGNMLTLNFNGAISQGATADTTVLQQVLGANSSTGFGTGPTFAILGGPGDSVVTFASTDWTSITAPALQIAFSADTTNGALAITVIGIDATTIQWMCDIQTSETTF